MAIACGFNGGQIPGPRGNKWRDTAIRGLSRQIGTFNNSRYCGRYVFNKIHYRKDPTIESRAIRLNAQESWVVVDRPDLRIIDDEL